MSDAVKADAVAVVSFKDLGKNDLLKGQGIGAFATVAFKRTVNDVTYTFRTTDTTYRQLRALNGASLSVARPIGPVTAKASMDLGPVKTLAAELVSKLKYAGGRSLELKALWSEKAQATTLQATAVPAAGVKLRNTVSSKNRAVVTDAELTYKGFTLAPAVNWQTQDKGVSLSRRAGQGTLKGSYAIDRQIAALEYKVAPYKVAVSTKTSGPTANRPTLTFTLDRTFDLSGLSGLRRRDGGSCCDGAGRPRRDIPLDAKLKELDAAYEPRIKQAQAAKVKHAAKAAAK